MSKLYHCKDGMDKETDLIIKHFILEIVGVCKRYDISISHEDRHGAFELEPFNERNVKWLNACHITEELENKLERGQMSVTEIDDLKELIVYIESVENNIPVSAAQVKKNQHTINKMLLNIAKRELGGDAGMDRITSK